MIKFICDICGHEEEYSTVRSNMQSMYIDGVKYNMCRDCYLEAERLVTSCKQKALGCFLRMKGKVDLIDTKRKIIAVDFDGTLCDNQWPDIGAPNRNVIMYLKDQQAKGAKVILWTCRSAELLDEAIAWCKDQGLIFDAVNENVPEAIEHFGGDSRKIYADEYIDDKSSIHFVFGPIMHI